MNGGVTFIRATGSNKVAIGEDAGQTGQGSQAVAVGLNAGQTNQGSFAVAVGREAGQTGQGTRTVAVGVAAGQTSQGSNAVAVGSAAGSTNQGTHAVAVGPFAGQNNQGSYAIAVGYAAGNASQGAQSIVINATDAALNNTTASSCRIKPIRSASVASKALAYDSSSGEITENPNVSFDTGGTLIVGTSCRINGIRLNMLSSTTSENYRTVATIPAGAYKLFIRALRVTDNTYGGKIFDIILNKGRFGPSDVSVFDIHAFSRSDVTFGTWPVIQHQFLDNGAFHGTGLLRLNLFNANAGTNGVQFVVTITMVGDTQDRLIKTFTDEFE
jgi:hypothetical protein